MSVDATMAVLYAQTGLGTSLVNAQAVNPQASLAMSRLLAAELAHQEQQQVVKSEAGNQTKLSPEARDGGSAPQFGSRRRHRHVHTNTEPPPESEAASPLVGNFLNIKV